MSEWMGLHNVHKHQPISRKVAAETTQGWLCTENAPCRLCLAAEVEALRAQVARVRELHYNTATHHPSGCCSECGGTYPCPTVRAFDGGAE
jgi:hypothetical protein